jgi:hypothetical protein
MDDSYWLEQGPSAGVLGSPLRFVASSKRASVVAGVAMSVLYFGARKHVLFCLHVFA